MIKRCALCGVKLNVRRYKYCEECSEFSNKECERSLRNIDDYICHKDISDYHNDGLINAVAEATKQGISYGQYMAENMKG